MCRNDTFSLVTCHCSITPSSKKSRIPNGPRPPKLESRDSIPQRFRVGVVHSVRQGRSRIPDFSTMGIPNSWSDLERKERIPFGVLLFFNARYTDTSSICLDSFVAVNQDGGAQHLEAINTLGSGCKLIQQNGTYPPRRSFPPDNGVSLRPVVRGLKKVILCGL